MANVIDELVVEFNGDASGLNSAVKEVQKDIHSIKQISAINLFGQVLEGAKGVFDTISASVHQFVNEYADLDNFSKKLNTNVEDLQAWGHAVAKEGGSLQGLMGSLENLSKMSRGMKDPIKILEQLSGRMGGMNYYQASLYAKRFGIDDGTIRLLMKGGKQTKELIRQAKELGVARKKDIESANRLRQVWMDLDRARGDMARSVMSVLLPVFEALAKGLLKISTFINSHKTEILDFFTMLGAVAIGGGLVYLATHLAQVATAMKTVGLATAKAMIPFLAITAIIAGLYLVWNDLMEYFRGGESVIGDLIAWFDDLSEKSMAFKAIIEALKAPFEAIFSAGSWLGEKVAGFFNSDEGNGSNVATNNITVNTNVSGVSNPQQTAVAVNDGAIRSSTLNTKNANVGGV